MRTYTLTADTINGVLVSGDFDGAKVLDEQDFLESLDSVKEGEIIASTVSQAIYDQIQEKYGIHA